jgi:hydrogenase nickel incorporation protein HypA/HybF
MHELGLAEDVLNKIKAEARSKGLKKVSYAKLQIGETLITDRAEFEELFAMISAGSIAEGIKMEIEILPVKGICIDCKTQFTPKIFRLDCASCGSTNIQMVSGGELVVKELR